MDYETFFRRFGGSARTKNVRSAANAESLEKRPFVLPESSELPKEFIRLCPWEMEYVFAVARRARRGILEIGRLNGGSTFVIACANPDVPIYSIDIEPKNDRLLQEFFKQHDIGQNVRLLTGDSAEPRSEVDDIDLIFIDGDHGYAGCQADVATWYPRLAEDGHLLFHDSYLGPHGVQDVIVDFLQFHPELEVLVSPFIGASYWFYPAGSLAHVWKRPQLRSAAALIEKIEPKAVSETNRPRELIAATALRHR